MSKHIGHDSLAIANIFVEKAFHDDRQLTVTQLTKVVYIAHGWTLGWTGNPLIRDRIEAWVFGPVVPKVYWTFRKQGIRISMLAGDKNGVAYRADVSDDEATIISNVYKEYSHFTPYKLTNITHRADCPWSLYNGRYYHEIDDEDIAQYYRKLVRKAEERSRAA